MSTFTIGAEPALTLKQLEDWLWGQEVAFGPVIAIGNNGHSTAATFEWANVGPSRKADIRETVGGIPIGPAGSTMLCKGQVFLTGQLKSVAVYRLN